LINITPRHLTHFQYDTQCNTPWQAPPSTPAAEATPVFPLPVPRGYKVVGQDADGFWCFEKDEDNDELKRKEAPLSSFSASASDFVNIASATFLLPITEDEDEKGNHPEDTTENAAFLEVPGSKTTTPVESRTAATLEGTCDTVPTSIVGAMEEEDDVDLMIETFAHETAAPSSAPSSIISSALLSLSDTTSQLEIYSRDQGVDSNRSKFVEVGNGFVIEELAVGHDEIDGFEVSAFDLEF